MVLYRIYCWTYNWNVMKEKIITFVENQIFAVLAISTMTTLFLIFKLFKSNEKAN